MTEQFQPDSLPKRSSDFWQKMYFPVIVLVLGGCSIAWNSLFYSLGWEAPMSDIIEGDLQQGERSSSETGAMSVVLPTQTPMAVEAPIIVTEEEDQDGTLIVESKDPIFGEGWSMVFDYLGRGINIECYGVTAENTTQGDSVMDVLKENIYTELGVWVLGDYVEVRPDGSFEVKKGIRNKFSEAQPGNTYCVNPPD